MSKTIMNEAEKSRLAFNRAKTEFNKLRRAERPQPTNFTKNIRSSVHVG